MTTTMGSFSDAFSAAYDILESTSHPVVSYMESRAPTIHDSGNPGETWWDLSRVPVTVWVYSAAVGSRPAGWFIAGQFRDASFSKSSARLWRAALLRTGRWWLITKAPLGVLEGDMGSIYVSRFDSEADSLLRGFRGIGVPLNQVWPTVDEVVAELMNTTTTHIDATRMSGLDQARQAAIEWVVAECEDGWL